LPESADNFLEVEIPVYLSPTPKINPKLHVSSRSSNFKFKSTPDFSKFELNSSYHKWCASKFKIQELVRDQEYPLIWCGP
jgi:hypothetical protein